MHENGPLRLTLYIHMSNKMAASPISHLNLKRQLTLLVNKSLASLHKLLTKNITRKCIGEQSPVAEN